MKVAISLFVVLLIGKFVCYAWLYNYISFEAHWNAIKKTKFEDQCSVATTADQVPDITAVNTRDKCETQNINLFVIAFHCFIKSIYTVDKMIMNSLHNYTKKAAEYW